MSVKDYLKTLDKYSIYDNALYRGQSSIYLNISASLYRNDGYKNNELSIMRDTLRHRKIEFTNITLPIDQLSIMQHYGIPTRLIDLTYNPLNALFFAVEQCNNEEDGEVFIFIKDTYSKHSIPVKLLSLLPKLQGHTIETLQKEYLNVFNENIHIDEISKYVKQNIYIFPFEDIDESNVRLSKQKGTFVICGIEEFSVGSLKIIERSEATYIYRIPYEYKKLIKDELDVEYGINESIMYPELTAYANYIREKYKVDEYSLDDVYKIVKNEDVSYNAAKRINIEIVLLKKISVQQIQAVIKSIIAHYQLNHDVVYVNIAGSNDDWIMNNWIVRAQWVSNLLNELFRPSPFGEIDENGVSWFYYIDYPLRNEYNQQYIFDDDKNLFVYNLKEIDKIRTILSLMFTKSESCELDNIGIIIGQHHKDIMQVTSNFDEFGRSKNREFDRYLDYFQELISNLNNVILISESSKYRDDNKLWLIKKCVSDMKEAVNFIDTHRSKWKNLLCVSDDDYNKINFSKRKIIKPLFLPTIPINKDGLVVKFTLKINQNDDKTISVSGKTNLFGNPRLQITVRTDHNIICGHDSVIIKDFCFGSSIFGMGGKGYEHGNYVIEIVLSVPSTQPKDFIKLAGIEYENLIGEYVIRTGLAPIVKYTYNFSI